MLLFVLHRAWVPTPEVFQEQEEVVKWGYIQQGIYEVHEVQQIRLIGRVETGKWKWTSNVRRVLAPSSLTLRCKTGWAQNNKWNDTNKKGNKTCLQKFEPRVGRKQTVLFFVTQTKFLFKLTAFRASGFPDCSFLHGMESTALTILRSATFLHVFSFSPYFCLRKAQLP